MGIPSYFHNLTKQYKNIIRSNPVKCDRLFLDFNGIIHTMCQQLRTDIPKDCNKDLFEKQLILKIIEYTNELINMTKPTNLVYLCIDGVAPLAKIKQQRKRRYVSAFINTELPSVDLYNWDTNAISPGTPFMKLLDVTLKNTYNDHNFSFDVIISGSSEPGEGEHKIFDYIDAKQTFNTSDVVYGLDADLIMLSLIAKSKYIYLLRESQHFNQSLVKNEMLLLDIPLLRNSILNHHNNKIDIHSYVCICILLGNDFLPNLSYISIHNNGIDILTNKYIQLVEETGMSLVAKDADDVFTINQIMLSKLFEQLADTEDTELRKCHNKYYERNVSFKTKRLVMENFGITHKCMKSKDIFETENWRSKYYMRLFDANAHCDTVSQSSKNFIDGIFWNFHYYFNKRATNNWYYRFNYSPSILDIYHYIQTGYNGDSGNKLNSFDIRSDEQLLLILPPQSFSLLKKTLTAALRPGSGICHLFAEKFSIMTYQKNKLHECHPNLPDLDVDAIRDFVRSN